GKGNPRLEQLDREIRAVLKLVERSDPEEQREQTHGAQRLAGRRGTRTRRRPPPTAEKRRTDNRQATDTIDALIAIHRTCIASPPRSWSAGSRPIRASSG